MASQTICILIVTSCPVITTMATAGAAMQPPDFEGDIAPLLIRRCVECHSGPDASGNLRLTTHDGLLAGGDSGAVIDTDSLDASNLLQRVIDGDMPPERQSKPQPLPSQEVELLTRWVNSGAEWPAGRILNLFERTNDLRAGRDWWSLQPVERPDIPKLANSSGGEHPIDAFVHARQQSAGFRPAPIADRRTLLSRMHFVLTGLPPTNNELDEFAADTSPNSVTRTIDDLLSSPHFGERWARHWLDVVRFADTSGYERDQEKPFAWKYRDWVVDALNSDMPYDQFVIEQLAGDEIPQRTESSVIATGFLRLGTWNDEPNDPLDYQYDRLEDLVHTTSSAFLAMTVKCARCHGHKFDPITQADYYRMASVFWVGPIGARDRALLGGPSAEELGFQDVLGWTDLNSLPTPLHRLRNGERLQPLEVVESASLSMIPAMERLFDEAPEGSVTTHRRLQLARWIADPAHPLTARVMVNRIWLQAFGEGIVRSPNNFGFLADPPTHPELLDWLAMEFTQNDWSVKRLLQLILTSRTWQQASVHPQAADYEQRDSTNRLLWRANRRRLDAEAMRDAMLAATGELDLRIGGPPFKPTVSEGALEGLSMKSSAWQASPPEQQLRRSLYIYMKRGLLPPMMTTFDLCDPTASCGQRGVSTVPTQSLSLMNSPFVHERSASLALSTAQTVPALDEQIRQLFIRVLGRTPSPDEHDMANQFLSSQTDRFAVLERIADSDSPHQQALASLAHVLLNSNEFLYVD
jgi:Protein of unknown function (DUF1553)/Protein of unknown function (DUF1549)/Planctomycete cytochrome C